MFLDPNSLDGFSPQENQKINIILSPALYWVKKLSLPVKSVREVKKLLPSIFEDTLIDGDYSYFAYKYNDDFFVFAYEDKKIIEQLTKAGVSISNISSIHFAQSEFQEMQQPLNINKDECLYLKDDIVTIIPKAWVKDAKELELENIKLSKHTIKLQQYGHIVKNSSLIKIAVLLVAFIALSVSEIFVTSSKISKTEKEKENIFSKYKLQSTMFQNKSTLKKYTKIHYKQTRLRKYISYFLNLKLDKTQKIKEISLKEKRFLVKISGVDDANAKKILSQLDSKKLKYEKNIQNNTLYIEAKI
jgi:hypothetical protein